MTADIKALAWRFYCAAGAPVSRADFEELWADEEAYEAEQRQRAEQDLGYALMSLLMSTDELNTWHAELMRQVKHMVDGLIMRDVQ